MNSAPTNDKLEVTRSAGFFTPNVNECTAHHWRGLVCLIIDGKAILMRTPKAHRTGFDLVKQAHEALENEFIELKVNGVALNFPPKSAKQVGAALLRRADDADDFQKRLN